MPFLEGVAAISLAAEGQVVGAFDPFARALERHYVKHATAPDTQRGIRAAVHTSLAMWWQFFDRMERAPDPR